MSLGLLAKDSIGDLEACAARAEAASSDDPPLLATSSASSAAASAAAAAASLSSASAASSYEDDPATSGTPDLIVVAVNANPQQAQEDDRASSSLRRYASGAGTATGPWPPPSSSALKGPFAASKPQPSSSMSGPKGENSTASSDYYYAGFETAYHGDAYYHETYSSMFLGETKREPRSFWDCLFPCLRPMLPSSDRTEVREANARDMSVKREVDVAADGSGSEADSLRSPTGSREDDEVSTNSDVLGERLSDKERQAVLARLRLAQPDVAAPDSNGGGGTSGLHSVREDEHVKTADGMSSTLYAKSALSQRGLLNGIPAYDTSPLHALDPLAPPMPLKGILKRGSFMGKDKGSGTLSSSVSSSSDGKGSQPVQRRSLFPQYETTRPKKRHNYNVSFAPMARVVTVKSKNDMTPDEKSAVWFQKPDYEDFRKTGRIITKAMLEGGSEIWLTSSLRSPTDRPPGSVGPTGGASGGSAGGGGPGGHGGDGPNKENPPRAPGDKWWHKFGHSRRGLEHIVSFDEGRQRQSNVRNAIHAVLEEQARQRRYRKEDPEKLRTVALHHTSWARDLALAAGASDADAVHSSFAEDRKSREFFLLKMVKTDSATVTGSCRIPEFMNPALHSPRMSSPHLPGPGMAQQKLDANTAAHLRFRQEQASQGSGPSSLTSSGGEEPLLVTSSASNDESDAQVSSEPIKDPNPEDKKEDSMAQRAKGFLSEGAGRVDMSAVLSGLGAVESTSSKAPKAAAPATAPTAAAGTATVAAAPPAVVST